MVWLGNYMHSKIQEKKREIDEKRLLKEEKERLAKMKEEEEIDAKARKDIIKEEVATPKLKSQNYELLDIDVIDPIEDNPAKILK